MQASIQKTPFKNGLPLEFEIIDLENVFYKKASMMTTPHRAQFYHILIIEKGSGTHYIDFKPVSIEDKSIIFIPQNSVNLYDIKGSYTGKAILFTDKFFCKNKEDGQFLNTTMLFSSLYDIAKFKNDTISSEVNRFLNAMQTEYVRNPDVSQYSILHNLLHIFLLQSEREMRKQGFKELQPSTNLTTVLNFRNLLEEQFQTEKSVKTYAAKMILSEKQLHKATTAILDKTPKQIIDERIILEAKRLLVHSKQAVKEIAYELGFEEPTNFIKYFKKHSSHTPNEFRKRY
ncbi:AraC family transcriptional regulator [Flavicella sediminum]|uniref:AraC family transcriptional regulator n=1 Tax=Flavicella sediminum TaxID=2585141 RepID=UPI00111FD43D|nr:helix-turn-helix domain-containing protein [Flavicella sediminum]